MTNPIVSIIVPVFNTEQFLSKCLDSLVNQTLRNIEILVVNDGSTDNSKSIIEGFARMDSRVKYLENTNKTGSAGPVRNTGIDAAKGDYIGFVDSDDWVAPQMYERMWMKASQYETEGHSIDIVVGGVAYENGNKLTTSYCPDTEELVGDLDSKLEAYFKIKNSDGWSKFPASACNKLYKSSLFIDNELRFPPCHYEDAALAPGLLACSQDILFLPEVFYYYVMRNQGTSRTMSDKHILDRFHAYQFTHQQLRKFGVYARYKEYLLIEAIERSVASLQVALYQRNYKFESALNLFKEKFHEFGWAEEISSLSTKRFTKLVAAIKRDADQKHIVNIIELLYFQQSFSEGNNLKKAKACISYATRRLGLYRKFKNT